MRIVDFIKEKRLFITAVPVTQNPHMDDDPKWEADHWLCVVRAGNNKLVTHFSKGLGLRERSTGRPVSPTLLELLGSLALNAADVDNASTFEDWANNLGLNPDSRKTAKTYAVVKDMSRQLFVLLGKEGYRTLLYDVEPR